MLAEAVSYSRCQKSSYQDACRIIQGSRRHPKILKFNGTLTTISSSEDLITLFVSLLKFNQYVTGISKSVLRKMFRRKTEG